MMQPEIQGRRPSPQANDVSGMPPAPITRDNTRSGTSLIYLLVLADTVIRMDLTEAIHELYPGAEVLGVDTPGEAEARLEPHMALAQAFVSLGPEAYAGSRLETEIDRRGARVVLLGDAAEDAPPGRIPVLWRPFNRASLRAHLQAVSA